MMWGLVQKLIFDDDCDDNENLAEGVVGLGFVLVWIVYRIRIT